MSLMRLVYHTTRKNKQYVVDVSYNIKNEGCCCSPHFFLYDTSEVFLVADCGFRTVTAVTDRLVR